MRLLDAINLCLRMTGHSSVNDPDDADANAQSSKATIKRIRRTILTNGYPFNRDERDLIPGGVKNRIEVGTSLLRLELPIGIGVRKDKDDGKLYLWDIAKDDWHLTKITKVGRVFDIANPDDALDDFERIPQDFAEWIARKAVQEYWFENNQANNPDLERQANEAAATAINSLAPESIFRATGFSIIRAIGGGGTGVTSTTGRVWINVG